MDPVTQQTSTDRPSTDFDICAALPQGTTVLEASAGTGKTYAIAALAARYVAEGNARLDQLLLVTFGRMATSELRSRVHDRLVTLEARMADALAGREQPRALDPLEALLIGGSGGTAAGGGSGQDGGSGEGGSGEGGLNERHRRVAAALADFDGATIATTHQFCQRMLDGLGVLGDREPDAVFVDQITDLTEEVATDLYLQRYAPTGRPPFSFTAARQLAHDVVDTGHTRLVPEPQPGDDSAAAQRWDFARAVRMEVEHRKRRMRLFTYDDMLTRLRDALTDPVRGEQAAQRLRDRYSVVLVDEFQDTDPVQWEIIERAFHHHRTLILIGDPKQAIYAFRGADVYSYLAAVGQADQVSTLGINRRSDQALVEGLDALWGGAKLGDDQISVRPVRSAHPQRRLTGAEEVPGLTAPVRLRYNPHEPGKDQGSPVDALRGQILADLVADITVVLDTRPRLELVPGQSRPVEPADIAVIVRKNRQGEALRDALVAAGVPAVMHGATSVFASEIANEWLTLLTALDQPRQGLVREAALTCFFGWDVPRLVRAEDSEMAALTARVRGWSRLLVGQGVAALLEAATVEERVPERLLVDVGGARRLTDLRHLAQLLHRTMSAGQLGIGALAQWLRERMAEDRGSMTGDGIQRLETDAKAVTIVTVHRSKGLEFPIVYLPEAWDRHVDDRDELGRVLRLHENDPGELTGAAEGVVDVGGSAAEHRAERFAVAQAEDAGEDLRLAYVAFTRAQCQVVTWWVASWNTPASALQRFLLRSTDSASSQIAPRYPIESGDPTHARPLGGGFALEAITPRDPISLRPTDMGAEPGAALSVQSFDRQLDLDWRRTSYSALTSAVHGVTLVDPGVGSETEVAKENDEAGVTGALIDFREPVPTSGPDAGSVADPPTGNASDPAMTMTSPMAGLPMGADFGSVVHAVLENIDASAADLLDQLRQAANSALLRSPVSEVQAEDLASALLPCLQTPLGPLADDRRLCDITAVDTLAELSFEFPLAGGDRPRNGVTLGAVSPLLRRHLTQSDPLHAYAEFLAHPALGDQPLRGYLTGSIDAVFRLGANADDRRYLVADYKTNWLGSFDGEPLTVGSYTPAALPSAMMQAHYPLQALLYSVALHRLLRWRQPDYEPSRHLGGVLYLFVRGMAGASTPRVGGVCCGVFSWRPPAELITELSDLLAGFAP